MTKTLPGLIISVYMGLAVVPITMVHAAAPSGSMPALPEKYRHLLADLHPVRGDVRIPAADAVLHLGDHYDFLDAPQAKRVLIEGWGNPPDAVTDVLGMVFPAGKSFVDDTWGAVVTYEVTGYVADEDAKSADFDKVLADMRTGEDQRNRERKTQGFAPQHLVGWAQAPTYDPANHSLIWARDIRFGGQREDALNYDVRLLGRRGVLSLNMVSSMPHLTEIRPAANSLGLSAAFIKGARYTDYDASSDKTAGYGIAGLVAAGAGVAVAKKVGFLALLAVAGKKLLVFGAVLMAGIASRLKSLFRRKTDD